MKKDRAKNLLEKMMKKELYVILSFPVVTPAELYPKLAEHLSYLIRLEEMGVLFASGPLSSSNGTMTGHGLTVVRVKSFKEAETIAKRDPFVRSKMRTFEVKKWTLNEGRIDLSVRLSDCSGRLP